MLKKIFQTFFNFFMSNNTLEFRIKQMETLFLLGCFYLLHFFLLINKPSLLQFFSPNKFQKKNIWNFCCIQNSILMRGWQKYANNLVLMMAFWGRPGQGKKILPDWLCYLAGCSKSHRWNLISCVFLQIKVLYMSFDRFLLAFESSDLSQAEKSIIWVFSFPQLING